MAPRTRRWLKWTGFVGAWVILAGVTAGATTVLRHDNKTDAKPSPRASAVVLGYVVPAVAIPGLPEYLTGRDISAVRSIKFVPVAKSTKLAYIQTNGIRLEPRKSTQINASIGLLSPGRYKVYVVEKGGTSNARRIRVEEPSRVRAGEKCFSEWGDYTITGSTGADLECTELPDKTWRWTSLAPSTANAELPAPNIPTIIATTISTRKAEQTAGTRAPETRSATTTSIVAAPTTTATARSS